MVRSSRKSPVGTVVARPVWPCRASAALGWKDAAIIDEDLGRSGSGVSRAGFEKLLAAICDGRVGAVLAIEASRLARNSRDWHTLIEFCCLAGTLIMTTRHLRAASSQRYSTAWIKGTMSELELSILWPVRTKL
ncbi:recombinase family protein [Mesorhizobium sp. ORM6]